MKHLQKIHAVSSFLLDKGEKELTKTLSDVHQHLKEKLGLPPHIRVTGLAFEHVNADKDDQGCEHTCTKTGDDGKVFVFCCP